MRILNLIAICACLMGVLSCSSNNNDEELKGESLDPSSKNWSYSGETSPEYWEEIERNSDCGGKFQSPINIIDVETTEGELSHDIVRTEYQVVSHIESITNNGHSIQYNFDADSNYLVLNNAIYRLKQFHFHSPSEHTINGIRYPLEIHMVHYSEEDSAYAVFAVLVHQGRSDPAFTFIEKFLPIQKGETKAIDAHYNFDETYPELVTGDSLDIYTYKGSLTTPPCTERVLWMVMKEPTNASPEQIELLQQLMPTNNYRETQPLNGRQVYKERLVDDL